MKDVTRNIKPSVEKLLWGKAAGRCQFSDCNRPLYKSPITQEQENIAEMAHIYSFSKYGPRGRGPFSEDTTDLNEVDNLMLVCHDCHKTIDGDKKGHRYSATLLQDWKVSHEERVFQLTDLTNRKRSHVVIFSAKIASINSPIDYGLVQEALFPTWFPAQQRPIILSMQSAIDDDSMAAYWQIEAANLTVAFERSVRPILQSDPNAHFSIFAFAPQPLLITLGTLICDRAAASVYQLHREPKTWTWQPHPENFDFRVIPPKNFDGHPVLIISLSASINQTRIQTVFTQPISIWELTIDEPHNDFLRSEAQLSAYRQKVRSLMVEIMKHHPMAKELPIFPAMPVACSVDLGRVRMPKADLPWLIYDQNNKAHKFIFALQIG